MTRIARPELAAFLRGRRARVQPADVGLPEGARRRTAGLRREEVARLADVGASWYTWLEQGRDIQVSEAFLERLAQALRLSPAERTHLFELAQGRAPRRAAVAPDAASATLQRVLDAYPYPALAATPRWDVVAHNRPVAVLFCELVGRNSLVATFTDPRVRARLPYWEVEARAALARFRLESARAADRAGIDAVVAELSQASAEFRRWWTEHDVQGGVESAKIVAHPLVGEIAFDRITLAYVEPAGGTLRITLDIPQPGESAERAARVLATC